MGGREDKGTSERAGSEGSPALPWGRPGSVVWTVIAGGHGGGSCGRGV